MPSLIKSKFPSGGQTTIISIKPESNTPIQTSPLIISATKQSESPQKKKMGEGERERERDFIPQSAVA